METFRRRHYFRLTLSLGLVAVVLIVETWGAVPAFKKYEHTHKKQQGRGLLGLGFEEEPPSKFQKSKPPKYTFFDSKKTKQNTESKSSGIGVGVGVGLGIGGFSSGQKSGSSSSSSKGSAKSQNQPKSGTTTAGVGVGVSAGIGLGIGHSSKSQRTNKGDQNSGNYQNSEKKTWGAGVGVKAGFGFHGHSSERPQYQGGSGEYGTMNNYYGDQNSGNYQNSEKKTWGPGVDVKAGFGFYGHSSGRPQNQGGTGEYGTMNNYYGDQNSGSYQNSEKRTWGARVGVGVKAGFDFHGHSSGRPQYQGGTGEYGTMNNYYGDQNSGSYQNSEKRTWGAGVDVKAGFGFYGHSSGRPQNQGGSGEYGTMNKYYGDQNSGSYRNSEKRTWGAGVGVSVGVGVGTGGHYSSKKQESGYNGAQRNNPNPIAKTELDTSVNIGLATPGNSYNNSRNAVKQTTTNTKTSYYNHSSTNTNWVLFKNHSSWRHAWRKSSMANRIGDDFSNGSENVGPQTPSNQETEPNPNIEGQNAADESRSQQILGSNIVGETRKKTMKVARNTTLISFVTRKASIKNSDTEYPDINKDSPNNEAKPGLLNIAIGKRKEKANTGDKNHALELNLNNPNSKSDPGTDQFEETEVDKSKEPPEHAESPEPETDNTEPEVMDQDDVPKISYLEIHQNEAQKEKVKVQAVVSSLRVGTLATAADQLTTEDLMNNAAVVKAQNKKVSTTIQIAGEGLLSLKQVDDLIPKQHHNWCGCGGDACEKFAECEHIDFYPLCCSGRCMCVQMKAGINELDNYWKKLKREMACNVLGCTKNRRSTCYETDADEFNCWTHYKDDGTQCPTEKRQHETSNPNLTNSSLLDVKVKLEIGGNNNTNDEQRKPCNTRGKEEDGTDVFQDVEIERVKNDKKDDVSHKLDARIESELSMDRKKEPVSDSLQFAYFGCHFPGSLVAEIY